MFVFAIIKVRILNESRSCTIFILCSLFLSFVYFFKRGNTYTEFPFFKCELGNIMGKIFTTRLRDHDAEK